MEMIKKIKHYTYKHIYIWKKIVYQNVMLFVHWFIKKRYLSQCIGISDAIFNVNYNLQN